jgi:hypothetical protein
MLEKNECYDSIPSCDYQIKPDIYVMKLKLEKKSLMITSRADADGRREASSTASCYRRAWGRQLAAIWVDDRARPASVVLDAGLLDRVSGCAIGGACGCGAGEGIGWEEEAGERRRRAAAAERGWMNGDRRGSEERWRWVSDWPGRDFRFPFLSLVSTGLVLFIVWRLFRYYSKIFVPKLCWIN